MKQLINHDWGYIPQFSDIPTRIFVLHDFEWCYLLSLNHHVYEKK
jgi:hypothetical protein